ncbi:single-stranded DNA-binding protein [Eubacterium sp. AF18-3]|nr:single-stranded DNA-binding protein [Eubacterium sp. AF18-3]
MINRVVLVGRLTKDPILRKTQSGSSVTSFTVACDRRIKTEGQPTADFINCVCWNKVADNTAQYTHKGSLVGVEGRIQTRSYDDQSGRRVYVTEVVADSVQFLEPKGTNSAAAVNAYTPDYDAGNQGYQSDNASPSYSSDFASSDTLDIASDDLPF